MQSGIADGPKLEGAQKRKHRWRPGTVAMRDIRKAQRETHPLLGKKLVNDMVRVCLPADRGFKVKRGALAAIREAASAFMVDYFTQANKVRYLNNKSKTLTVVDTCIGRATMGVACMSDISSPMILPLAKKAAIVAPRAVPVAPRAATEGQAATQTHV